MLSWPWVAGTEVNVRVTCQVPTSSTMRNIQYIKNYKPWRSIISEKGEGRLNCVSQSLTTGNQPALQITVYLELVVVIEIMSFFVKSLPIFVTKLKSTSTKN